MYTPSLFVNRNDNTYFYRIGSELYDTSTLSQLDIDIRNPNIIEIHGPFHIDLDGSQLLFIETMNNFLLYQQQFTGQFVELNYGSYIDQEEIDEVRDIHIFKVPTQRGMNGVFDTLPLRQIDPSLIDQIRILCSGVPLTNQIYRRILNILNYSNQSRTVYVYNLPFETTIDQIRDLFDEFITESVSFEDGVGIVTFVNAFDVNGSILMLNNTLLNGDAIQVTNQRLQSFTLYIYGVNNSETSFTVSSLARTFGHVRFELSSPNEMRISYDNYQESANALEAMNGFRLIEITRIPRVQEPVTVYVYNVPFGTHTDIFRTIFDDRAREITLSEGTASMVFDNPQVANNVVNEMNGQQYGNNVLEVTRITPDIRNYPPQFNPNTIYAYNLNPSATILDIEERFDRFNPRMIGLSDGSARIDFSNPQDADLAIQTMNFTRLMGVIIHVTREYPRGQMVVPQDYHLREPIISDPLPESYYSREFTNENGSDSINLMIKSYETYMRQVYNLPVPLPEFLILNGLKVPFIPFSEIKNIQIDRYVIDPILQPWAGPLAGLSSDKPANRIVTIFGKNGMTYLVKAKYDQVNNQIFQPV
jgi:RNA recognition motif-containing protein